MPKTPSLKDFRRIVVKVGSALLVDASAGKLNAAWLTALAADIAGLHKEKRDVLVVSSGAIALDRDIEIVIRKKPRSRPAARISVVAA